MKIGGYQILDVYNFDFTVGTGQIVPGVYALIKSLRGKPINTSNIIIGGVVYPASYVSFIPDGTSFKGTFGDKTITVANNDTVTITNGIIGGGGGGGTQVQANWTEEDTSDPSYIQNKPTLAEVATSGDYDDLENKPTIPAPQVQADWEEEDTSDLSYIQNKPTIPTQTSDLTNDSNYIVGILTTPATLTAGNTSVTITDANIGPNSNISVLTSPVTNFNSITVSGTTATLTFDSQQADVSVKLLVW